MKNDQRMNEEQCRNRLQSRFGDVLASFYLLSSQFWTLGPLPEPPFTPIYSKT